MKAADTRSLRRAALVALLLLFTAGTLWWALRDNASDSNHAASGVIAPREPQAVTEFGVLHSNASSGEAQLLELPASAGVAAHVQDPRWPEGFETMQISGRVVDESGRPMSGAELRLLPEFRARSALGINLRDHIADAQVPRLEREQLQGAVSDRTGGFRLEAPWLPDGGDRRGYDSRVFPELLVFAEGYATHAFACLGFAGGAFEAGDLVLEHTGAEVVARLVDPQGVPIAGVELSIVDEWSDVDAYPPRYPLTEMPVFRMRSDATGRLHANHLWPGRLEFSFVHRDYDPALERGTLVPGELCDLGTLVMDPLGVLHGRVLDADGRPIAGAEVSTSAARRERLWSRSSWKAYPLGWDPFADRASGFVNTDEHGAYSLGGFERRQAPYTLVASAPGFELATLSVTQADSFGNDLRLHPEATLQVRAFDARDGSPVKLTELLAAGLDTRGPGASRDALADVRTLRVEADLVLGVGYGGTRLVLSAPGFMKTLFDAPGVRPGESRDVEVPMQPTRRLAVRVVDKRGDAVPDARVVLRAPMSWGPALGRQVSPLEAVTDVAGRAEFWGVPGEHWQVEVRAPGHLRMFNSLWKLSVEQLDVEVKLERSAPVVGRLLTASGAPAVAVPIRWVSARDGRPSQVTDLQGRFRFEVRAGPGELRAPRVPPLALEAVAGEECAAELVQQAPFVLTGQVLAAGRPVEGARLMLLNEAERGRLPEFQSSDAAGHFRFEIEHALDYHVVASWNNSRVDRRVLAQLGGKEHLVIDFGAASLAGFVSAGDSDIPLNGLRLTLKSEGSNLFLDTREVARDGHFRFDPLPPGRYDIHISGNGCVGERWGPYELSDGTALEGVQLRPKLGASVTGHALRASGRPFRGAVHLRSPDRTHYEVATADYREGRFEFHGLPAGTWQLDLAETTGRALGDGMRGVKGIGEPGAELPFFAREFVTLTVGEELEVDIVIPGSSPP